MLPDGRRTRRAPAARAGDGQGRRPGARDRRQRHPGLHRQPDRLASSRAPHRRSSRRSASAPTELDIRPVVDPRVVPRQPARPGRGDLRAVRGDARRRAARRAELRGARSSTSISGRIAGPASTVGHRAGSSTGSGGSWLDGRRRDAGGGDARPRELGGRGWRHRDDRRRARGDRRCPRRPRGRPRATSGSASTSPHAWGAGIDVGDPAAVDAFLAVFDARIGLDRLVMIHLNDTRSALGSRTDRHEHLGAGRIPVAGLAPRPPAPAPGPRRRTSSRRRAWTPGTTRSTSSEPARSWAGKPLADAAAGGIRRCRAARADGCRRSDRRPR